MSARFARIGAMSLVEDRDGYPKVLVVPGRRSSRPSFPYGPDQIFDAECPVRRVFGMITSAVTSSLVSCTAVVSPC